MAHNVFVTGGTGYIGGRAIPALAARGHTVRALMRAGSERKLPAGCSGVSGNALDRTTFAGKIAPSDTFVQLVGVAHPSPSKADQFRAIDLLSLTESVAAAKQAGVKHFIYLSVAQPAPAMKAYVAVRAEGERLLRESGIPSTFIRPWYVLGPGHRWPYMVLPLYWLAMAIPKTRETAHKLYPVKLSNVVNAIVDAVEHPPSGVRIMEQPALGRA